MVNAYSYGTTNIEYSVEFRDRKTMAIEVHPDGSVQVIAPFETAQELIHTKIEKRASWIAKQLRFFRGNTSGSYVYEWVSGESIYYLGRQYRLKILEGQSNIKLSGKYLLVQVKDRSDKTKIERMVNAWYLNHAKSKFKERLALLHPILDREGLLVNSLIIRKINKRWGSCTKKGNLVLNVDLIKVPVHCIDYVLIHEICHLKHHNHGSEFWSMLTKYCPDWVKLKNKLENF